MSTQLDDVAIRKLTIDERLELVDRLCGSIEEETIEISPELRRELERRLAAADANPNSGSPWDDVRARIQDRLRNIRSLKRT